MTVEPWDQMRPCILDMRTYGLAEQAGMFCDGLENAHRGNPVDFSGSEFTFDSDEPYEVYFEWYFGDILAGVSFHGDRDDSEWFVNRTDGNRRFRFRQPVGDDTWGSAKPFLEQLSEALDAARGGE